jgi:hypothetical protein
MYLHNVLAICLIHRKIQSIHNKLNVSTFRDIFHSGFDFTENKRHVLVDRIFSLFDKQNTLQVSLKLIHEYLLTMIIMIIDKYCPALMFRSLPKNGLQDYPSF